MKSMPFVHKFRNNGDHYIYDVNTNNIIKVDECLFDIVDNYDFKNEDEIINKYKDKYSPEKVRKGLSEIKLHNNEKGLFCNERPSEMFFPFNKEEIKLILNSLLHHIVLNVTEDCNLRCEYCKYSGTYNYSRTHNKKYMKEDIAYKAIEFVLNKSDYHVNHTKEKCNVGFYGGEPLLSFNLIKKSINFVKKQFPHLKDRISFSMTTNGTLINEEMIDLFIENEVSLLVSLDGPQDIHDRYKKSRSHTGTFDTIAKNLKKIKEQNHDYYKRKIGFSIVLAPPYDLFQIISFFMKEELATEGPLLVSYVDEDDTSFFDRFENLKEINNNLGIQIRELKKKYEDHVINGTRSKERDFLDGLFLDRLHDIYQRNLIKLPDRIFPNGICLPGFQKILVSPEGKFYICEKIGYSFPIGDVFHGLDIDAIYSIIERYIKVSESVCLDCWALRLCKCCFVRAQKGNKFDIDRKMENCQVIKNSINNSFKLYCDLMEKNPKCLDNLENMETEGGIETAFKFIEEYNARTKI